MAEAARNDARWKSVIANGRAIHGALGQCLKLSDQLTDPALKGATMTFVNAMEFLVAQLLGERRRAGPLRSSDKELINKLREETLHVRQLLEANDKIAKDLGDDEAQRILFTSINTLVRFEMAIDRKRR